MDEMMKDIFLSALTHLVYIHRGGKNPIGSQKSLSKHLNIDLQTGNGIPREMAPHFSHWPHSARVIPWQKCVTSTCFDGIVYWAEDGNGVGYIYTHMPRTQHSA